MNLGYLGKNEGLTLFWGDERQMDLFDANTIALYFWDFIKSRDKRVWLWW